MHELDDRVRAALADRRPVREVRMFGARCFMVDERLVVGADKNGDLLVRADPERTDKLLDVAGARQAEMGAGRAMSHGWITVAHPAVASDADLEFWTGEALAHHDAQDGAR